MSATLHFDIFTSLHFSHTRSLGLSLLDISDFNPRTILLDVRDGLGLCDNFGTTSTEELTHFPLLVFTVH